MDVITLGVEVKTTGAAQSAQQLGQFTGAAQGAAGAADKLEDQLNAAAAAQTRVAATGRPLAGAMAGVGQAFSQNAPAIQNTSFQLQDLIVQISGGVDATKALGMQLPQLLGGFGPLGAVLGVVAGALLSFAPALLSASDSGETLADTLDALSDSLSRFREAQQGQNLSAMTERFGEQTEAARAFLAIQTEIARIQTQIALSAASEGAAEAFGSNIMEAAGYEITRMRELEQHYARIIELQDKATLEGLIPEEEKLLETLQRIVSEEEQFYFRTVQVRREVENLEGAFNVTADQATEIGRLLAEMGAADGPKAQADAARELAAYIFEATDGLKGADGAVVALYDNLLQVVLQGMEFAGLDLSSGLSSATAQASALADEMARAASNAITMAAQSLAARRDAEIRLANAGDPVATARALAEAQFNRENAPLLNAPIGGDTFALARETFVENAGAAAEAQLALTEFNSSLRESAGGARQASEIEREAQRLYESTRTEAERYTAELARIEELYQSGAIDGEVYARAVEKLNEELDPFTKLVEGIANTVENELNAAFAKAQDGIGNLGDALLDFASNVLAKVAQDLFAQQFAEPISSGLTSILGSALGSLGIGGSAPVAVPRPPPRPFADGGVFGPGGLTAFANGGVVSGPTIFPFANGTGLMGEAGPEAIMPLARGADGKLGVVATGGGSAPTITINNYSGQEATASTDSAGNILVEIGRAVAQDITAGGPAYRAIRTTFGLSNRLQQRG